MIDHTVEQVEEVRKLARDREFPNNTYKYKDKTIDWYVGTPDLNKDIPAYVGRWTNDETKKYVLLISSAVPKAIHPYLALSEYIEFIEIGVNVPGRVLEAEKRILKLVPNHFVPTYLAFKVKLYETELTLNKTDPNTYALDEFDIEQFTQTKDFLKQILSGFE